MSRKNDKMRFAILGGGPSGLFMFKRFIESGFNDIEISIFESGDTLGIGMPYSKKGANFEHVTNVSDNEIPEIVTSIDEWIKNAPESILKEFDIAPDTFNEYKVLPRLFFGKYLEAQFMLLLKEAESKKIKVYVHLNTNVIDVCTEPTANYVCINTNKGEEQFDCIIMCTGHHWPLKHEGKISGYYDSPYPPAKLKQQINYPVAIKGASLTAIDAVRTLARCNGRFETGEDGLLTYILNEESAGFKIVLHSKDGLLPAVRFHLEDSHLSKDAVLSTKDLQENMRKNDGFVSLDNLFEINFKEPIRKHDPDFYEKIRGMTMEEFVDSMMAMRESIDAFQLLKGEYAEAEKSIKRKHSVYWKEMLAVLSFAMNYPAKHLSAEDMLRLQKVLMPLISIVIAFVPQSSCKEIIALHDAGLLTLIPVSEKSNAEPHTDKGGIYHYNEDGSDKKSLHYEMFIDCVGQPHLSIDDFPFKSLVKNGIISPARIRFRSNDTGRNEKNNGNKKVEIDPDGCYFLSVPGITIDDNFCAVDVYGASNNRIYIMSVPYIGGFNPDYSGLDFGEAASERIIKNIIADINVQPSPNL